MEKKWIQRYFAQWDLQMMVLPAILLVGIFSYIPMYGILMAFQQYNIFEGMTGSPWIGFDNFRRFFSEPRFLEILRNTIMISVLKIAICFPAPVLLALMLNEVKNVAFKRVVQTITYLPHFLSWVIVAGFTMSILSMDNGSLNIALESLNLIDEPINFLSIPRYFWTIIVTTNL